MAMILSLITIPLISQIMVYLFHNNKLKKEQDIFMCIVNIPDDEAQASSQSAQLRLQSKDKQFRKMQFPN